MRILSQVGLISVFFVYKTFFETGLDHIGLFQNKRMYNHIKDINFRHTLGIQTTFTLPPWNFPLISSTGGYRFVSGKDHFFGPFLT